VDLCVMIEGQEGVTWPQWQAIAAACEEQGIPALFRSDHYLPLQGGEKPVLDAWATVNALAATTSTLRLGTLVSPTTFRHPAVLAKTALTADHISGGRVELGIGAGWHEGEHEAFGFAFGTVGSRMDVFAEQLRIVREHLDGRFLPGPTGSLPIIVGGRAKPRTVALAAQYADEYNTVFATPDECRERRAAVDAAWHGAARGQARFSLMTGCVIGRTREDYERRRRAVLGDDTPHPAWVSGTLDEAASHLRELREAGVDRVMLQLLLHEDLEQIELIGALA
jgi:alkanesulfonate monooxygenase SsuD/methylene tetrahydromethanopterin reductase-like flavin-dependent oxidoreductase (luciferase family)